MPRILRIHNRLIIGGPTLNILNLTKHLQPDFETLLIVGEKEDHEQDATEQAQKMGITPIVIPEMGRSIHPLKDYTTYRKIKKIIKDFKPDIVHTHAAKPGAIGRMAAANGKVPCIVHTYHGHVFHSYFGNVKTQVFLNIERTMGKKTDRLIAISKEQKRELSQIFSIAPENKFSIIPLGFDLSKFTDDYTSKRIKFRKEFQLDDDTIAVGIIGRVVPIKNHALFIKGLYEVLGKTHKKIKAFIVGDGESRAEAESLAKALNISFTNAGNDYHADAKLVFTSWRTDVDVINAGLDIVCLTSLNEGTPVSLIEAQAANTPIVSTRVGGIADMVIEGETALLSETNDVAGFATNLLKLVEDAALRNQMSQMGWQFVHEKYSIQRLVNDFRKLYYEILSSKNRL